MRSLHTDVEGTHFRLHSSFFLTTRAGGRDYPVWSDVVVTLGLHGGYRYKHPRLERVWSPLSYIKNTRWILEAHFLEQYLDHMWPNSRTTRWWFSIKAGSQNGLTRTHQCTGSWALRGWTYTHGQPPRFLMFQKGSHEECCQSKRIGVPPRQPDSHLYIKCLSTALRSMPQTTEVRARAVETVLASSCSDAWSSCANFDYALISGAKCRAAFVRSWLAWWRLNKTDQHLLILSMNPGSSIRNLFLCMEWYMQYMSVYGILYGIFFRTWNCLKDRSLHTQLYVDYVSVIRLYTECCLHVPSTELPAGSISTYVNLYKAQIHIRNSIQNVFPYTEKYTVAAYGVLYRAYCCIQDAIPNSSMQTCIQNVFPYKIWRIYSVVGNSLREFACSSHPDPRRVWKGGSLGSTCWHHFRGLRGLHGQIPKRYMLLCFTMFLAQSFFLFSVKSFMLPCFTMILAQSLFHFSVKNLHIAVFYNDFGSSYFLLNLEDGRRWSNVPKGTRQVPHRYPRMAKRIAKGRPMGAQRHLKGTHRHTIRPQGVPQVLRDGEVEPKVIPKGAKGSPRQFQSKPMALKRNPMEASGALCVCKLSINRPSGRYVIRNMLHILNCTRSVCPYRESYAKYTYGLQCTLDIFRFSGPVSPFKVCVMGVVAFPYGMFLTLAATTHQIVDGHCNLGWWNLSSIPPAHAQGTPAWTRANCRVWVKDSVKL